MKRTLVLLTAVTLGFVMGALLSPQLVPLGDWNGIANKLHSLPDHSQPSPVSDFNHQQLATLVDSVVLDHLHNQLLPVLQHEIQSQFEELQASISLSKLESGGNEPEIPDSIVANGSGHGFDAPISVEKRDLALETARSILDDAKVTRQWDLNSLRNFQVQLSKLPPSQQFEMQRQLSQAINHGQLYFNIIPDAQ